MKQWFVVHTQPQKELLASQELINQDFEVYYPKFSKIRRHDRRVEVVESPLFPRYIFISFDPDRTPWRCINGTRGVIGILLNGNRPICIPTPTILSLQDEEVRSGFISADTLSLFTEGKKVHIIGGALEGYKGTIIELSSSQRVQLLIEFMGRQLQIGVSTQMIEAA